MSLKFERLFDERDGAKTLAEELSLLLKQHYRVLWLVPGGSNIKIAVMVMDILVKDLDDVELSRLRVTLTDERYGLMNHKDSNYGQLIEAGFDFEKVTFVPVLVGLPLYETINNYGLEIEKLFIWADVIIGQFGIGPDGHIAGVLPATKGVYSDEVAVGYESDPFIRITLTLKTIRKIDEAYAFVIGSKKRKALLLLKQDVSLNDLPSQILKDIPKVFLYTDQVL